MSKSYEIKYHDPLSGTEYNFWKSRAECLGDRIKLLQEDNCTIISVRMEEDKEDDR